MNATEIAARLSRGQRTTIMGLSDEPAVLGCSEPTALRLAKAKAKRPALVRRVQVVEKHGDLAIGLPAFVLTDEGTAVKAAIQGTTNAPQ